MYDKRHISPHDQLGRRVDRCRSQAIHHPDGAFIMFRALVGDDSPEIMTEVKDLLESLGHTCDLAYKTILRFSPQSLGSTV